MRPEDSPFPRGWWGTSLGDVRPEAFTYHRTPHELLPRLPIELTGSLDWLAKARRHEGNIGRERASGNEMAIRSLSRSADGRGLRLPDPFVRFLKSADLQSRVRSNTDCFLDVCPALGESPIGGGFLARFLADSQGCVFWYLYLTRDGTDHAVVASTDFHGTPSEEEDRREQPHPAGLVFAEASFEAFLCRFWLENEIWFAGHRGTPIPEAGAEYLRRYRRP
jgi:hypothetical protein